MRQIVNFTNIRDVCADKPPNQDASKHVDECDSGMYTHAKTLGTHVVSSQCDGEIRIVGRPVLAVGAAAARHVDAPLAARAQLGDRHLGLTAESDDRESYE